MGKGFTKIDHGTWENIGKPATDAEWKKVMLLPDSYMILSVDNYPHASTYTILVEHEGIPVVAPGVDLPSVSFSYHQEVVRGMGRRGRVVVTFVGAFVGIWSKEKDAWDVIPLEEKGGTFYGEP